MSMIRKYHNHKLQTTPWHREEEPLNHHETPGRQIKQSMYGQLSSGDLGLISILSSVYALTLHMRDTNAQVQV